MTADKTSLQSTIDFFELKPVRDNQFLVQLGVHFEEFGEMLDQLESRNEYDDFSLGMLRELVRDFSTGLKAGTIDMAVKNEKEFLDSLLDQIVTAAGTGHYRGYDMVGGLGEVNSSNMSKTDENGKLILDDNGKIIKGTGYVKPNLERFL